MKHEEHDAQVQLIAWCNAISCAYPDVGEYCALPNGGARNIVTAVNLKREGGAYIPHPATWLNQGRWADEVLPPRREESRREREARLEHEEREREMARAIELDRLDEERRRAEEDVR